MNNGAGLSDFSVYTPIRLPRRAPAGLVVHMLHGTTAADRFGGVLGAAVRRAEARGLSQARWISTTSRRMESQLRGIVPADTRITPVGRGVPDEFAAVARDEGVSLLGASASFKRGSTSPWPPSHGSRPRGRTSAWCWRGAARTRRASARWPRS